MVKMVILLHKQDSYSHEEFAERLQDEHAPMAEGLPGLERYSTAIPSDPEAASVDGISELYFESGKAMAEAFETEAGQRVQADAAEFMRVDENETLVLDETVHVER